MKTTSHRHKKILKAYWIIVSSVLLIFVIYITGICLGWFGYMPGLKELDNPQRHLATEVFSADGKVLGSFYLENRNNTEYSELPPSLINALVAREDHRFYSHAGVDMWGTLRVFFKTLLLQKKAEGGGSTITQQLAKTLFPRDTADFQTSKFTMTTTKFKEWIIAIQLERKYTKQEILTLYLNSVAFSSDVYGIKAAAQVYFNKPISNLTIEESALLIGILKGISLYNPNRNPQRALNRRNSVLHKMYEHHYIGRMQFDSLKALPVKLSFKPQNYKSGPATYMREYLRVIMNKNLPNPENYSIKKAYQNDSLLWTNDPLYGWCNKNVKPDGTKYNLYKDGLKIYTTIDSRMQEYAESALTEHLSKTLQPGFFRTKKGKRNAPFANNFSESAIQERLHMAMLSSERHRNLKKSGFSDADIEANFHLKTDLQVFTWNGFRDSVMTPYDSIRYAKYYLRASFLAVDPSSGYVKAYVGGPDIHYFKYDGVTKQKRQVGSTIKPFVYAVALNNGFHPCDKVLNAPVSFSLANGSVYTPQNDESTAYDNKMVTLTWGLAHSVNYVVANLFQQVTYIPVIHLLRNIGIKSDIPEVPSIFLGTPEFSLMEVAGAYTIFPGKGIYTQPIMVTRIEDKNGIILSSFNTVKKEVLNEQVAYTMTQMLKAVVTTGTARHIQSVYGLKNDIAGKTGTTQNQSDGWFVGFTPDLVAATWVGGDEPSIHFDYMSEGQGASMALPIYALFMKKVYADKTLIMNKGQFDMPAGYHEINDCTMDDKGTDSLNTPLEDDF